MSENNTVVIYPHPVMVAKQIATFLIAFVAPIYLILRFVFPDYAPIGNLVLGGATALFIYYTLMNYTKSTIRIEASGVIIRKGWIPSVQNNIFWANIKDADGTSGALESLFGCGTVTLRVAIRADEELIKMTFVPNYEQFYSLLRKKIGEQYQGVRAVTYT